MKDMLERIYAGFLGMNIGIRLGAPVEPAAWDFERIAKYYGDIRGYVKNYKNFAADDDVIGTVSSCGDTWTTACISPSLPRLWGRRG